MSRVSDRESSQRGAHAASHERRAAAPTGAREESRPGDRRAFVLRRLFSLTGIVPLGVFTMVHLWTYSRALAGRQALDESLASTAPFLLPLEIALVWLPLVFHAGYGIRLTIASRPNSARYPYSRNWMYLMQRVTGVAALAFVAYHFWQFRWPLLTGELASDDLFVELCASLSSTVRGGVPLVALAYLLGVAAVAFHLANGLYGFCFTWGITTSRRATRLASAVFGVFGILLFALGGSTVIYFATGSRVVLAPGSAFPGASAVSCRDLRAGDGQPGVAL
jgi:succinate dehydrogenase/fumarate reductase cytochrome b subunit (b558 family)